MTGANLFYLVAFRFNSGQGGIYFETNQAAALARAKKIKASTCNLHAFEDHPDEDFVQAWVPKSKKGQALVLNAVGSAAGYDLDSVLDAVKVEPKLAAIS
jgi:hypothetical protein